MRSWSKVLLAGLLCGQTAHADPPQTVGLNSHPAPAAVMSDVENEILRLTNLERARAGIAALLPQGALVVAAREHCNEMLRLGYFDHASPLRDHAMPWDRVERAGFQTSWVAENLYEAEGYSPREIPRRVVRSWMSSAGHRLNILDTRNVYGGIGLSQSGPHIVITQVFSAAQDTP